MGNLITSLKDLPLDWYFVEHKSSRHCMKTEIASSFPYSRAIHTDHFEESYENVVAKRQLKIDIRRFVQRQCLGDVVISGIDMSYEHLYQLEEQYRHGHDYIHDWWRRRKIDNWYHIFHFEEESDAALFSLKFAGLVTEISNRHPGRRDIPEEEIEHAEREKHKGKGDW